MAKLQGYMYEKLQGCIIENVQGCKVLLYEFKVASFLYCILDKFNISKFQPCNLATLQLGHM